MIDHYWLPEMTWPEFKTAASSIDLAIIPVGSTEQHGPGGTFAVDSARAEAFVRLCTKRLYPRAVGLPCFPYAVSVDQMEFPGTISLSAATQRQVMEQAALSLYNHGLRKILFVSGHSGSGPVLNIVLASLKTRHPDLLAGWVSMSALTSDLRAANQVGPSGHADESELSECLYLAPDLVRNDLHVPVEMAPRERSLHGTKVPVPFQTISRTGGTGNPASATYQLGQTLISAALHRLESYVNEHF